MQIYAYFRPPEWGTFSGQSWTQKFKPNQKWPRNTLGS